MPRVVSLSDVKWKEFQSWRIGEFINGDPLYLLSNKFRSLPCFLSSFSKTHWRVLESPYLFHTTPWRSHNWRTSYFSYKKIPILTHHYSPGLTGEVFNSGEMTLFFFFKKMQMLTHLYSPGLTGEVIDMDALISRRLPLAPQQQGVLGTLLLGAFVLLILENNKYNILLRIRTNNCL